MRRVRAARTLGVSVRRLEGWEPAQTTTVTAWTDDGRPAAWTTHTEPEWTTRERSLMLALDLWEASLCRRCGEHLEHATNPEYDPDNLYAGDRQWLANEPDECLSCKALVKSERQWATDDDEGRQGWLIHTTRLAPKKPMRRPGRR